MGELKAEQIKKLKILQDKGHEITCHGYKHINAQEFLKNHSYFEYLEFEVTPALNQSKQYGLHIQTFAYPFGRSNNVLDSLLATKFTVLRALTGTGRSPEEAECYWMGGPVVKAIGIDYHQRTTDLSYLKALLEYARDNDKIIVFFGHNIEKDNPVRHVTPYEKLEFICRFVKDNKMGFYRLKDLPKVK